jgi:hypothetical protein
MAQGFHDSQFDAEDESDGHPASKQGAGANLIALGRNPKTARVIVITALAVLLVGFLVLATMMRRQQQVPTAPAPTAAVDVGRAPTDPPISRIQLAPGQAERTRELEAKAAAAAASEAKANGESVQPNAERVEASLKPALTPEEAAYEAQRKAEAAASQRRAEAAMAAASAAETAGYQVNPPPMPGQAGMRQPDPAQEARLTRASDMVQRLLARTPPGSQTFQISPASIAVAEQSGGRANSQLGQTASSADSADEGPLLIQAGTIEVMQMDTAVNTDRGNKFRATLLTGPFKGATINGTYKRAGEAADLELSSIALRSPKMTLAAQGVGLDPVTWEIGTATDVDRKLLVRYGVKPLAAGIAAIGEYLRTAGTTVVVNNGTTVTSTPPLSGKRTGQIVAGAAAAQVSNDSESLNVTPTAKVARGSVVGVYFTADVRAKPEQK